MPAGNAAYLAGMPLLELGLRIWFRRRVWPGMAWRWGLAGLGFVIWLIGERLREAAGAVRAGDCRAISLSAGLAAALPGEAFEALDRRADRALYAAQAAGRNCIIADSA